MPVPNIFGTATAAIPLSQLDQNFATAITLGNTAVYLGNTTTSLGNLTLTNVTISSGTSNIAANVSTAVGLLPEASGGTGTTTGYYGFKNRIINGGMVIDQRNAGANVTATAAVYTLDRWKVAASQASKFTVQQSTDAPSGFKNSLKVTSSSAYSVTGNDYFAMLQTIEGYNVSDLGFGAAGASSVTFSFWVKSSLTGSFGGSLENYVQNRCYSFAYTVSAANTWEYKTVTAVGDTTGTWNTDNSGGMIVWFGLGATGTRVGTAGAWGTQSGSGLQPSGTVSVVGTSGATFYITGVQLEKGSTATSFDYRPYGTELALCQRYYYRLTQPTASSYFPVNGLCTASTLARVAATFPVTMRVVPTALDTTGTASNYAVTSTTNINLSAVPSLNDTTANGGIIGITVSSGLTQGNAVIFYANVARAYVGWSAEL